MKKANANQENVHCLVIWDTPYTNYSRHVYLTKLIISQGQHCHTLSDKQVQSDHLFFVQCYLVVVFLIEILG